ncbi:MAG: hypothetical protein IT290_05645 [Deltaproteobacteria bacterium]|nr:hypothetical protein [Deltaproteobacteria bacterium]
MRNTVRIIIVALMFLAGASIVVEFAARQGRDQTSIPDEGAQNDRDAAFANRPRKIIEFGWGEPNTRWVSQNIRRMERMPFDGLVMSARYLRPTGEDMIFAMNAFGTEEITWEQLGPALGYLKQTQFRYFTDNFLRVNTSPGTVDWFDDYSIPVANLGRAARFAREGGLKGLVFDLEPYQSDLFRYRKQRYHESHSFAEYEAQARLRGQEVMRAIQTEYPGITLFLTFMYDQAGEQRSRLPELRYGLLPAFLDGLLAEAQGNTTIVDGFEASYPFAELKQFRWGYNIIHAPKRPLCNEPEKHHRHVDAGFGIWMDLDSHERGWNTRNFQRNGFTPGAFTNSLKAALTTTDRYVWVYTQQPKWWTNENLPPAYTQAIVKARKQLNIRRR